MTIFAPHFCTQQTVTLNDTNPSKYLSRFGLQPVTCSQSTNIKSIGNILSWTICEPIWSVLFLLCSLAYFHIYSLWSNIEKSKIWHQFIKKLKEWHAIKFPTRLFQLPLLVTMGTDYRRFNRYLGSFIKFIVWNILLLVPE